MRFRQILRMIVLVLGLTVAPTALADSGFQSPSGNIVCHDYSGRTLLVCTTLNDGMVTTVSGAGQVSKGLNHGRYSYGRGPTVPYGSGLRFSSFTCRSTFAGVSCTEASSCHGFFIARGVARLDQSGCTSGSVPSQPTMPVTPPVPTDPPNFCDVNTCIPNFPNGNGSIVQCADGEYSHSGGIQGACSYHGGVLGYSTAAASEIAGPASALWRQ
ncbi:MAG: hypothetical protein QOI02_289 [Actinomycetota bacterium]|jgi:hypothetical protein|nr:hypothetical protein [Actinomycetota bacterium]